MDIIGAAALIAVGVVVAAVVYARAGGRIAHSRRAAESDSLACGKPLTSWSSLAG